MIETIISMELPVGEHLAVRRNRILPREEIKNPTRISLVSGIHGDELEGQFVCYEVIKRIREQRECLKGIVDIFLTDFKYMEEETAEKYSRAPDYPQVAKKALNAMIKTAGKPVFDETGMMQKGVIVRHLLLPGHKRNARAVIKYVYDTYGDDVYMSLMNQYTPFERLKGEKVYEKLCRKVTKREYE